MGQSSQFYSCFPSYLELWNAYMLVLQTGIIVFTVILQVFLFKTSPVLEQQQHTGRSGMPKFTYSFGSWGLIYYIHVIPPWSSWRLQEMSHKILLKYITFYQNFEISRKWMKTIPIYSIHFSKTSRKWKKNLPDASLKFITCMLLQGAAQKL